MQDTNIVWNQFDILKKNQIKCTKYSILHKHDSEKYYRYHNYLFVTNSVITSISSMSIITSNSLVKNVSSETVNAINIIFGGLIAFSTALNSFQHITNYIDLSNQHKNASIKYKCLFANISILLSNDKKSESIESFRWANEEFTTLENNSPIISNSLNYTSNLDIEKFDIKDSEKINITQLTESEINQLKPDEIKEIKHPEIKNTEIKDIEVTLPKNSMTEFVAQRWALNSLD